MGETTNQIQSYIETKREDLGSNLAELENKVKSITDWREHFRSNPMTMVGVAFGGGVLLATLLRGNSRRRSSRHINDSDVLHSGKGRQANKALETWDNIKGALIGVAATRFKDFVGEVIPGFHGQFRDTEAIKSPAMPSTDLRDARSKSA
jgi:hypothetical protein